VGVTCISRDSSVSHVTEQLLTPSRVTSFLVELPVSMRSNDRASLSLPDILAAGAGDRLRRILLFQGFLTNWTVFLPHIHTGLSSYE
jgi:hypothetical protein